MTIGLGQILLIIIIVIVLFGKFPGISKDLLNGITNLQNLLKEKQKDSSNEKENHKTELLDVESNSKVSNTPITKDTKDIK